MKSYLKYYYGYFGFGCGGGRLAIIYDPVDSKTAFNQAWLSHSHIASHRIRRRKRKYKHRRKQQ